jgi:pyridoxamine 5'-phosphate oxidase
VPQPARKIELLESQIARDPFAQFSEWYQLAERVEKPLPNAMALATASAAGRPSVRMVLLKDFDSSGFVFFTNYRSRKARDLARNASASLLFYWASLDRQVRIEGRVVKVSAEESAAYFATRPVGSQLGAWASPQSAVLPGRGALEARFQDAQRKYAARIPCPPHWGGYRLIPRELEFWQGRPDRLHDRIRYRRQRTGRWKAERLAP